MQHEETTAYLIWDLCITAGVTLAALYIPLQLVLSYYDQPIFVRIDWFLTLLFTADIGLNFWRPIRLGSRMSHEPQPLTRQYPRRWFTLDILAAAPFHLLLGVTPLQVLRLLKLARVIKLMRLWRHYQVQQALFLRLGFFAFWLGLAAHWLSCGWLALRGIPADSDAMSVYMRALYWCITTLTTVGYGDVTPTTNAQMAYTMVVMILGVGV